MSGLLREHGRTLRSLAYDVLGALDDEDEGDLREAIEALQGTVRLYHRRSFTPSTCGCGNHGPEDSPTLGNAAPVPRPPASPQ